MTKDVIDLEWHQIILKYIKKIKKKNKEKK